MCGPAAPMIAMMAISAAMTMAQQVQQHRAAKQQAKDQSNYQHRLADYNKKVADNQYASYVHASERLNLRDNQEREKAAQEAFDARLQSLRQREHARAASSGVSGISVDALLGDFDFQGARAQNAITANLNANLNQSSADRQQLFAPVQSAYNQANAPMQTIRGPSTGALAIGLLGTAAQSGAKMYGAYKNPSFSS